MLDEPERPNPPANAGHSPSLKAFEALGELSAELEHLLGSWEGASPPSDLYHFTDCAGLIGILQSNTLWASLSTALNDASEGTYALNEFVAALDDNVIQPKNLSRSALHSYCAHATFRSDFRVFVCSFCEAKEAAHWLHYGRAGTGVAIGFDAISLYRVGQFILYEVRYRQDDQRELLRAIVDLVDGYAGQFLAEPEALNLFAEATAMFVQLVAPWMKSPAFESEKEWRLISLQRIVAPETVPFVKLMLPGLPEPDPTRFRTANNRVIPYVTIPLPPSGLTHIELGAASPMSENEQSLRILAQECLRYPINITRSTVSVRP